ncbi:hypothetical protein SEA_TAPIOCA_21 [Mycobacterium phage Tapioca]|uniref:Uncharacterized protein n=14 Tax=Caudoviricetes TaxID=2731619 RepID=G1FTV9_9CAUD|nr:hypothetical protein CL81_gp21 [Mycobacterium phage Charlie]YP_009197146.1 hypothetical protein AVV74_gp21 [Mycobacterium phage Carcharodon]YP_009616874.1 hypothetical protein FDI84_gp21 [Mycobacterium phage Pipsqueaks]YP_010051885.1 hypothetical protein KD928_gp21 [Mycobacterium phage Philonius]YP_010051957.1 hypothetical protein KD929_gp21 [Mycobacterium phage Aggie]YP_010052294.1 hypothetical protein KD934_gp21 [Mycobacterium phage Tapioca]YP_010754813.1 hypothetical protein QEH38_gp24 
MAKLDTLTDDFTVYDPGKWTIDDSVGGDIDIGDGRAAINTNAGIEGVFSVGAYDLLESYAFAQFISFGFLYPGKGFGFSLNINSGGPNEDSAMFLCTESETEGEYNLICLDGAGFGAEGTPIEPVATGVTYDPAIHSWLRIRESGGTIYWETSPDTAPLEWSVMASGAHTFTSAQATVQLGGVFAPAAFTVSSFNIAPTPPIPANAGNFFAFF